MATRDTIVIGASAGGVPALTALVRSGVIVCCSNIVLVPEGPDVYSHRLSRDRAPAERDVSIQQQHSAPLEP
jgi:chemotaxis response regulator CheB